MLLQFSHLSHGFPSIHYRHIYIKENTLIYAASQWTFILNSLFKLLNSFQTIETRIQLVTHLIQYYCQGITIKLLIINNQNSIAFTFKDIRKRYFNALNTYELYVHYFLKNTIFLSIGWQFDKLFLVIFFQWLDIFLRAYAVITDIRTYL